MMTIFQRPSSMRKAVSIPAAAMSGVTSPSLPVGEYPTFLFVLAMSIVWPRICPLEWNRMERSPMESIRRIEGKRALVTGGTRGIGGAVAAR